MWKKEGRKLLMDEGDFGNNLIMRITGTTLPENANAKFSIRKDIGEKRSKVFDKIYTAKENSFTVCLTEEDSKKLISGNYTYCVELFKDKVFLNTIVNNEEFIVIDKE